MTQPYSDIDVTAMLVELREVRGQRDRAVTDQMSLVSQLADSQSLLTDVRQTLADTRNLLVEERNRSAADITLIGETLMADSGNEDAYDNNVEYLNTRIKYPLPVRERAYTVTFNVRVRLGVNAGSGDEAENKVTDDMRRIERTIDSFDVSGANSAESEVQYYDVDVEEDDE